MRSFLVARALGAASKRRYPLFPAALRCQSTASSPLSCASTAAKTSAAATTVPQTETPQGIRLSREMGLSEGFEGIGVYAGSISAFMKPAHEKADATFGTDGDGVLPCEQPGSQAAIQAAQAECMASVAMTGKLPSPSRAGAEAHRQAHGQASHTSSLPRRAPPAALNVTPRKPPMSLAADPKSLSSPPSASAARPTAASAAAIGVTARPATSLSSSPRPQSDNAKGASRVTADGSRVMRNKEATDYYRALPQNELSKEDMWRRINEASADRAEATGTAIGSAEVDYIKLEDELRDFDLFHYRIGEMAYPDQAMRRDYYALWNLAMSLNKARWSMLEVHSQRGMKTTGAGMKLIFWKESVGAIMEKRKMCTGQFTDSHPVLRPFAAAVERNPHMTKAFVRGFTDARLRVIQQPGNVQQLFDHFDKFYGYFFNSLLEVTHIKDEATEHLMTHVGRATGLTNHCVMFWKKYARLGFTMLPADLCADNHVNLGLLKNIPLASRDRAVRKVLFDVMCIVKDEMLHAQKCAKDVPPKTWPIVMECLYANYYLGFLQRRDFNVSAMFADHNIENAGFTWYRLKKRWEWERYQSIERLVDEAAPLPYINTSFAHRGSHYKMASGVGSGAPQAQRNRS
ncbi:phytoene synthase [Leishmania donovani]|uniref:Phytoene_synthase_putative/GeneDB:LmjF.36.3560 n=1 Tax=Leishmania donovani TaxID=5661 RepID=A0A6J8FSC3_LEIDO|nr:phytoene synthase [Leishmania donovani]VDZ49566.1 phytoene_synthase_putative/GeneDB:LmjF.36.3560 [Leishmania donovani]